MHVVYKIVRKAACRLAFDTFHVEIARTAFYCRGNCAANCFSEPLVVYALIDDVARSGF